MFIIYIHNADCVICNVCIYVHTYVHLIFCDGAPEQYCQHLFQSLVGRHSEGDTVLYCNITQAQQCRYTSQVDIFSQLTYHKCLFFHLKIISYYDGDTDAWISYRKDALQSDQSYLNYQSTTCMHILLKPNFFCYQNYYATKNDKRTFEKVRLKYTVSYEVFLIVCKFEIKPI